MTTFKTIVRLLSLQVEGSHVQSKSPSLKTNRSVQD